MTLGSIRLEGRDRRAVLLLAVGLTAVLVLRYGVYADKEIITVAAVDNVSVGERRLESTRRLAAGTAPREEALKLAVRELAEREKGLLPGATAAQAQARLMQTLRNTAKTEGIDLRGAEMGEARPYGADYGVVLLAVSFECRIEQLVNYLAALSREPEAIATNDIRVSMANGKEKTVNVRLGVAGLVPKALAPAAKGATAF